jgi:hypothetical protein
MAGAPTPQVLLEAIAANAPVGPLPGDKTAPMPETQPVTVNAASIQTGFPAITMVNENAGGRPPLGPDMNGLWFLVSSHTLYVECGQTYKYNSDLATSISGYLAGTILGMTDNSGLWLNLTDGNTTDPDAGGAGWVPMATYGFANVTGLTGGTVTLTAAQAKYGVIILNGTLGGNLTVNFPQTKQQWLVVNRTSGAFTTTAKTAASGSVGQVIPQGGFNGPFGVYSIGDGNIYPTVPPLGVAIDQNPTPLTLVERTSAGYVLATYFNQNSGLENPTVGAVFVQNSVADGFLRKISLTNLEAQMLLSGFAGQVSNGQVPFSVVAQWASALFSSPAFTGVPTTPTAALGTSNGQVASTAFANPGVVSNGNGFCIVLPNNWKIQFGFRSGGQNISVTFPVAFTSTVGFTAACTSPRSFMGGQGTNFTYSVGLSGMGICVDPSPGSGYWIAIGI